MTTPILFPFVIAVAVSMLMGYAVTAISLPTRLHPAWRWALAPGAGLGVCSLIFFLFRRAMFTVEFALVLIILFLFARRHRIVNQPSPAQPSPAHTFILGGALGLAVAGMLLYVDRMPHGAWDGWAIWNTHARLMYRDGPYWTEKIGYTYHADYPELTPAITARFWRYAGKEVPEVGALAGILLGLSGIAVLGLALSQLRHSSLGMWLSVILAATPAYISYSASQYADIPLSFYILSTVALIYLHFEAASDRKSVLALAGFMAGCAGWTKNEGLLFIFVTCVVLLLPIYKQSNIRGRFVPFCTGLLPPLAVILFFKLTVSLENDLIANQSYEGFLQQFLDTNRHAFILKALVRTFWRFGEWSISPLIPLFGLIALTGIDRQIRQNRAWLAVVIVLVGVLAGYYVVYVFTPISLQLHIDTSLNRLMLHLWPSFLLVLGLATKRRS